MNAHIESTSLVFTRPAWVSALRPLSPGGQHFAVGSAQWQREGTNARLLVEQLEVAERPPSGYERGRDEDWVVVTMAPQGEYRPNPRSLVESFNPQSSQILAVLVVQGEAWNGAVWVRGTLRALAGFQVVGPGMLEVDRHTTLPSEEVQEEAGSLQWSRTRGALGAEVFDKLQRSTVTLVGTGRNGGQLAFQLASLGIRSLRLIDPDDLGPENLDAMPGLAADEVGRPKAAALADRLLKLRPDLSLSWLDQSASDAAAVELMHRRCDLLVTCVDDDTPRLAVSVIARQTLQVHLDIGTYVGFENSGRPLLAGDARLLLPGRGCVACVGGLADEEATLYALSAPPGALSRGEPQPWHRQRAGSLVSLNAVTVGSAVQLLLDLLAGRLHSSHGQRLRWVPGEGLESEAAPVDVSGDCRFCRGEQ